MFTFIPRTPCKYWSSREFIRKRNLVIHRGKRIGEVVHDSRYKNALQPVSNLLNYAVQLFPPFIRDRDFPCPMIQT